MKKKVTVAAMALVVIGFGIIGLCSPMVYSLNDDVMMKHIVSGSYTGRPDAHLVYMSYPLTQILQLCYRVFPKIPWFSLFLDGCVLVCTWMIGRRLLAKTEGMGGFMLTIFSLLEIITILLFYPYLNMHYTVVAALLGGTAVFLFVTEQNGDSWQENGRIYVPVWILLAVCYMVRVDVFYMVLPFLAVSMLWKFLAAPKVWQKENLFRFLPFIGVTALIGVVLIVWNAAAYGSEPWSRYTRYNDSRTKAYDYTGILPYDAYPEVYDALQMTEAQYHLLESYHTVLDERISADVLEELAQSVTNLQMDTQARKARWKSVLKEYYYRTFYTLDRPYNAITIGLYLAVLCLGIWGKQWKRMLAPLALALGRNVIWLFLIYRGRYPERVTVSLYLIEILLLIGIFTEMAVILQKSGKNNKKLLQVLWGIGLLVLFPVMCQQIGKAYTDAGQQQEKNAVWKQLRDYCREHKENVYFLDVYSTVSYSEDQYEAYEAGPENYLLLGGWLTQSPLLRQKLTDWNMEDAVTGMLADNAYFICHTDQDVDWIASYYASLGELVTVHKKEVLSFYEEASFTVYEVRK